MKSKNERLIEQAEDCAVEASSADSRHADLRTRLQKARVTDGVTQLGLAVLETELEVAQQDRMFYATMANYYATAALYELHDKSNLI